MARVLSVGSIIRSYSETGSPACVVRSKDVSGGRQTSDISPGVTRFYTTINSVWIFRGVISALPGRMYAFTSVRIPISPGR